ncbi:Uncharacterised protein [Halioglobus japonicus]|nr:Uncharacterised protein [Halioglobus japonicus]
MLNRDYSTAAKLLHKLALGSSLVGELCFDIEQVVNKVDPDTVNESPVFVVGLARAGTTILLRSLYQTAAFRSLTYRDMPFVLMPATWRKLSSHFQRDMSAVERAHGDSIVIDFDSPEAFEEVFWRTFYGRDYIEDTALSCQRLDKEACEKFRRFVASVVASSADTDGKRYLSKNNNNLLRLQGLARSFPESVVIIPFREPVQHALSLLRQHRNFVSIQREDSFALKYMNWLGHHEFGLNHKPFNFPGQSISTADHDAIEYWLAQWVGAYNHALEHAPAGAIFLSYEDLCHQPDELLGRLMATLDVPYNDVIGSSISRSESYAAGDIDQEALASAHSTYRRLLAAKF